VRASFCACSIQLGFVHPWPIHLPKTTTHKHKGYMLFELPHCFGLHAYLPIFPHQIHVGKKVSKLSFGLREWSLTHVLNPTKNGLV
jgi:hypothetical protein